MPYQLRIDEAHDCAFIRWQATFMRQEYLDYVRDTAKHPRFKECTKRYHDLRQVVFDVPSSEVHRVARDQAAREDDSAAVKAAILVDSNLGYGVMRMFAALSERPDIHVEVFRDLEAANAWLDLPEDFGDPFARLF